MSAVSKIETWLGKRKMGLGGSDIGAIVGLNQYRSPLDVFLEKKGLATPREETRGMRLGKRLEPVIAEEYTIETGRKVQLSDKLFVHPAYPWAIGTPDGFEVTPEQDIFEAKAPGLRQSHRWGAEGTDEIPDDYLAQVTWYLAITGRKAAHVAALLGGQELRLYDVAFNEALSETLLEAGAKFWKDHIEADRAPDVDASDSAREYLKYKFPHEVEPLRPATTEEAQLLASLFHVRARLKEYETNESLVENLLKEKIGEAAGLEAPDVGRVAWKVIKGRTVTDWEALALSLKPAPLLVEQHTKVLPGPRRFVATPERK